MKYIILLAPLLISSCASQEEREEAERQRILLNKKINNVTFVSDKHIENCNRIAYLECKTRQPDGEKTCRKWFQVRAAERDGNVVVLKDINITYDTTSTQYGDVTRAFTRLPGTVYSCEKRTQGHPAS